MLWFDKDKNKELWSRRCNDCDLREERCDPEWKPTVKKGLIMTREELKKEALDVMAAINEITEWKVATTNSIKILGDLIARQDAYIDSIETQLINAFEKITDLEQDLIDIDEKVKALVKQPKD